MKTTVVTAFVIALLAPAVTFAQKKDPGIDVFSAEPGGGKWVKLEVIESASFDAISHVTKAPFFADAVTEFTQVLGDGNRIERRYTSSIARDSRGRTRREEEIALLGPLTSTGPTPKLVTIVDPDDRVSYTLDENLRVAHRNQLIVGIMLDGEKTKLAKRLEGEAVTGRDRAESLGRRLIEGVMAEGTRTTSTIPAGAVGNIQPIAIVSERWFSPELQMPVLITRRDPRSGDTVYRLINIVRAEPSDYLFTVPPDYEMRDGKLNMWKKLEASKAIGRKGAK